MQKSKKYIIYAACCLLGIGVAYWQLKQVASETEESDTAEEAAPSIKKPLSPEAMAEDLPQEKNNPDDPLYRLNHPDGTIEQDVAIVENLFFNYFTIFQNMPTGTHQEIVSALQGSNPRGIAYLKENHPAINEENKIEDRWGTPFFFHQISRSTMEIMSAGPDKIMWTEDDTVLRNSEEVVEPVAVNQQPETTK